MRIGIDIRPLQADTKHRGIGKSLEFFLGEALPLLQNDTVIFYVDGRVQAPDIVNLFPEAKLIKYSSAPLTRKKFIRSIVNPWRPLRVSERDVDVVLQYDASLGVPRNVPACVIFHDLIPYLFHKDEVLAARVPSLRRTLKNRLAGTAYWQQYKRFLNNYRHARSIIAISESSRKDYISYLHPAPHQHITVVPHGVDASFFKNTSHKLSKELSSQITKPFFLYIGGIDYRKNINGLLSDFLKARQSHPSQLVLVGKEFSLQEQLNDLGWQKLIKQGTNKHYEHDIIRPGFVSHEDLVTLLHKASALVFPSKYEGFGMPLLEAMAAGCPVITYDNSSLPEVVGTYGTVLPTGTSFAATMKQLLKDPEPFQELAESAKKRAQEFTWKNTATAIIDELHRYRPSEKKSSSQ